MKGFTIIIILVSLLIFEYWWFSSYNYKKIKLPLSLKYWGVLFFGDRGSGKTLQQAQEIINIVEYWKWLWKTYPVIKHGIIVSNQVLSNEGLKEIGKYTIEKVYYYFDDGEEMHFCPRKNCWRGKKKHILHGAVIVLDDIATYLPADGWASTPYWMRKQWTQAQHLGLHFLFNCQEPMAYDINARRATQFCFRFDKVIGSARPDETAKPIKHIWGVYVMRKIKAKWLWQFGNLEPEQIVQFKEAEKAREQITKKRSAFRGIFSASWGWISYKKSMRYDTLQDVKEYEPQGYIGIKQYDCIDKTHNHTDKLLPNYTTFKKNEHELI